MTPTTQFRIPSKTKELFKNVCTYRNVSMSQVVISFIERYIAEQTRDPAVMRHLRTRDTEKQTGLVQDPRGTWVKPETLKNPEDDWRHLL
jgi:antitoxin component of RelBE/YafQ-DinJ toxin-antitoxin module